MREPRAVWSAGDLDRLRALWAKGMHARAIGRELGRSRWGIVAKAHKLNLAPRRRPAPPEGSRDAILARRRSALVIPQPVAVFPAIRQLMRMR